MLGKNNYNERVKRMARQAKQDHFSIRKLSIGTTSVLLGFTFLGLNSKTVKADTVVPPQLTEKKAYSQAEIFSQDSNKNTTRATSTTTYKTNKPEGEPNLTAFSGLSSFLRENNSNSKQNDTAQTDQTAANDDDTSNEEPNANSADNNDINKGTEDKTETNSDNSDKEEPHTDDTAKQETGKTDKNKDTAKSKITAKDAKDAGKKVSVGNWKDFISALNNSNVSEIDITNNISADRETGHNRQAFQGRKLLIKSAGNAKYTLDFKSNHPTLTGNSSLDITYENLILKSTDYYGVADTYNMTKGQTAKITFRNIDFYGSQLTYTKNNTDIIFEGQIHAETVKIPSNIGGWFDGNNQQLLEFTNSNNSITFKAGCHFDGSTFGGTLIEMRGEGNSLNVEQGAVVNLTPLKTYDGSNGANNSEHGNPVSAIFISDDAQVTVHGQVNINIGQSEGIKYAGKQNNGQARAIYLNNANSKVNISKNGAITVNTNGNISTKNKQNLIYIGGDFAINSGGALKITGQNMGNYTGSLVQIDGTANVQNGGFEIQLVGDAGTGAIKLVDVANTGQLIVNNPTSLVLDAHLNNNDRTSIIGDNKVTVTNVRQYLNLGELLNGSALGSNLVLPPFHVLQVEKNAKTVAVNKLEVLNGQRIFDLEKVKKDSPQLSAILSKAPENFQKLLQNYNHQSYDQLFRAIVEAAFSNKSNPGYNNIRFTPANQSGFLDIDPEDVTVTNQDDGSKLVKGRVLYYDPAKDGPDSDSFFKNILPGGTEAYVLARFKDSGVYRNGQAIIDSTIANPYADTVDTYRGEANDLAALPTKFAAKVAPDGSFTIIIPTEITTRMAKDATIQLTPHANFIEYSPLDIASGDRPTIVSLGIKPFSEVQQEAAQEITDAINAAKTKKPANLTADQEKALTDALNEAAKYAATNKDNNYDSNKSVYGVQSSKTAISEINNRKKTALDLVNKAIQTAQSQGEYEKAKAAAIDKLTQQAEEQAKKFPAQEQSITAAKNQAISKVQAAATNNTNIDQVVNDGINAINQAGKDYRDNVKTDINQAITKVENAIDTVSKDENVKSPVDELINGIKDKLKRPKEIVAPDGDLDQDEDEAAINSHQKEAKALLPGVQDTIDAIAALEAAAKKQIAQYGDDQPEIQAALNQAIKDIINSNNPKDDLNNGIDKINGTHANKEKDKAANGIKEAATQAKERIQNSDLTADEQKTYLDEIDEAVAAATATTGDTAKSIYGTDDGEIINKRKAAAESLINKAAAKAEIAGYTKGYENVLGQVGQAETAMTDALAAIDKIEDNAASSQNIVQAENAAKENILNAFKENAKDQVLVDAKTAKSNLGVEQESNIDEAIANATKTIASHSSALDIKQDIIDGKKNVLNAYKAAAKAQIEQDATEAKNNLGVEQESNIDEAVTNATNTIASHDSLTAINQDIIDGKQNVLSAYKAAAKKQLETVKQDIVNKIQNNPNLTAKNKDDAANKASELLTGNQGYNSRIDNAETIADINTATKEGTAALNNLLDEQNLSGRRNQAIAAIQDAKDKAIAKITNNKNLSDEEKTKYQELINTATAASVAKITQDEDETTIATDEDNAIKNITGYQENAANTGDTNLNKQRQDAIKEVEEAANNALSTIDDFDDTVLSPEDKQHYQETINKDLANAKAAINAAKDNDGVNSARQAGKTSINEDLAASQLIVAKSQANIALQDEKKKDIDTINQAFTDNKINSEQKDALTDKINGFYETATSKVYNDLTAEQVAKDRDDGIAAMASVAGSIASEEAKYLEQQKDDALTNKDTGLNALAEKIRTSIEKDPNLSGKEKGDYYDEISSALTSAKTDIQNAHSQAEIATATNAGREALNKILANVVLQSSRSAALKELLNTCTDVSNQITNLQNVNSTTKDGLIKQLTDYYNDAVAKVKNVPAAQVDSEKQQGIDNMNTVIRDAQSLDTNIDHAKQEVDKQADQAISTINQSAMSDADKTQTIAKINDERAKAKQNIELQKNNDAVDKAKNDGKDAIGQVAATAMTADLENTKHHSEEAINQAAQEAISRLKSSYDTLSAEEKEEASSQYEQAISDINQAVADAKSKLQNGKTKDGINKITTDTINAINKAEASGNLAITKAQARKAIKDVADEIKNNLKDKKDQDSVDSILENAASAITAAEDSSTVLSSRDSAINHIKGIKTTADSNDAAKIKNAKDEAIKALTAELNGQTNNPGAPGILAQIDQITGLSAEEKAQYKSQATAAKNKAVSQINAQQTTDDIASTKTTGIINIDKALSAAQLQASKNNANKYLADISQTAADNIKKIEQSALSDTEKAQQIDLINSNKETAIQNINQAQSPDEVEKVKQGAENAITGIVQNAKENAALLQEQNAAYNSLVEQAKKLNQRLSDDRLHNKVDQKQYDDLSKAISDALSAAKAKISAATDLDKINAAKGNGETALNKVNNDIDNEEALAQALNDLQAAATNAKAKAAEVEDSTVADQMKAQIDQEQKKAATNIIAARNNKQNTITQIQSVAEDGITTINKLGEDFANKNQIVKGLKEYAANAKNEIDGLGLAGSDVANGYKDIDQALNDGISSIYGGTSEQLSQLEQDAKTNIDQAKLPSKLTAEKNKQINKFKDYVNSKGEIASVATNLDQGQIDTLQKQLDEAIKKTIDKIAGVKLESSYEDAKTQVENTEQGIVPEGETANFGEKEIDRIFQVAQEKAEIVKAKQEAISHIEQVQKEANAAIEKSGLSPADQQKQKEQIQKLVEKARTDINSVSQSETEAKDQIDRNEKQAITNINSIKEQTALAGHKTKAEGILKDKQTNAHNVIDQSQLTTEQKKAAKKAIDDAYKQSYQDIESAAASVDIPEEAAIGQKIDRLLTKPETGTKPEWFNNEQNNALKGAEGVDGINNAYSRLKDRLKDKLSPELLDHIDEQINAINNATDIQTTSAAYDEAMTIINKQQAKADIDEEAAKVTKEIDSNDRLATESKNRLKEQIKNDSQKAKDQIDAIIAPKGDTLGKKDQIAKITETAKDDINSAGNAAKDESISSLKADANNELAAKYQNAVAELREKFGENADTTSVDKAYHEHLHINGDSIEDITAAKMAAEKDIAKGAVADTANNAKNQVDKLKHQDGSDYTDTEKQAIKDYIDQEAAKANSDQTGTIDQAQSSTGIETARKNAVDKISRIIVSDSQELENVLNNDSKVQEERLTAAYDSAVKLLKDRFKDKANTTSIDQAYESAKDALNNSANADKLAATELIGEKEIAAGALADAQNAATSEIQSSSKYTEQEKKAIINQIETDMAKANAALKQPEVNDSQTITKLRDDAIKQMYLNVTDSATIDRILHDINHENEHSSSNHSVPAPANNTPVNTTSKEDNEAKLDLSSREELTLMHNAYLYDENGKRANKVILGAGSIITSYGTKEINGQSYYVLVDKGNQNKIYYIALGNVIPTSQKLKHNAYVYNKHGNRIKNAGVLRKGNNIKTYGSAVTIRGKKYYIIAPNRFVKAANIALQKPASAAPINELVTKNARPAAAKTIMHNSYLYDQNGKRANKIVILAGSIVNTVNQQVINGKKYYELDDGLFIAANNIDSNILKLRHNAYVYSQHGNLISKKVLKKQQVVKTYGSPVKINHEKYFIVAKNKFVKETNFK
ncbi:MULTISPECIES: SLAP domain-containing protein [unclassified Lactobacillus]|uniref:SLAP domain-containing protein n=1 Tax=unclassified Lactobacillus TaxID=2620435 RepID=UPI0018DE7441|nr:MULTISPECIES: SLAP domain-containing protein [unclassified Lactobacillus]MBH9989301.1 SLAP domain-containing protein [Lactobacillus sp. M0392]MBI0023912.1 SLAP domain-containing protein [Lactobacillus sp. W8171]MBI0044342.1 SLAP domain-containing protein [Lactobacillus sp. M0393]